MIGKKVTASEGSGQVATERRERKSDGHCEGRRVVQLEDPRRHDRMREFNFLGLSIISSARGFSSFLARLSLLPPFYLFSPCPSLISAPGWLSLRYPCERRTIFLAARLFSRYLTTSSKILSGASLSLYSLFRIFYNS